MAKGRRTSRPKTLRVTPKHAAGLTPYRKAGLENDIDSGRVSEGKNYNASHLVRGTSEPAPTSDTNNITRGEWTPSYAHKKVGVVNSPSAIGVVAHSESFMKRQAVEAVRMLKTGAVAGSSGTSAGSSVERLAPEVYSPLFTMANLNLPRDRITVNAWCFLPETMVWMADGTRKAIKDVGVGEIVLSAKGIPRKVTTVFKREVSEEVVGIKIKGEQELIWSTKNHGFDAIKFSAVKCHDKTQYVKCKPGGGPKKGYCGRCGRDKNPYIFEKIPAGQLEKRDIVYMPVPQLEKISSDPILNGPEGMELLGYYAAEGSLSRSTGVYFNFGLHEMYKAQYVANKLFEIWGGPNKPIVRPRKNKGSVQVEYHNKEAAKFFKYHCGKGACTKKISTELLSASPENLIYFLTAWLDGDGSQEKCNSVVFCGNTSSKSLAWQMRLAALRCGIVAHIFKDHSQKNMRGSNGKIYNTNPRYYVKIRGKSATRLSKQFSSDFYRLAAIDRQYHRDGCSFIQDDILIQYINNVEYKNYTGTVYNIEVEKDHTYIVGAGTSVFNCRNFFDLHPIVRNAITLHATYPISKLNVKCHDKKVENFFNDMIEEMDLLEALGGLSLEFWKIGEKIQGSSLITMADGTLKSVKDIEIGDKVLTHLGNKKRVIDKFRKPTNTVIEEHLKIYKIAVLGQPEPLIISGRHPIFTNKVKEIICSTPSCNNKKVRLLPNRKICSNCRKENDKSINPAFVETKDIKHGDLVFSPFNGEINKNDEFNADLCYIMGLWLAEGCFAKARRKDYTKYNGIKFTSFDKSYIDSCLKPMLKSCFGYKGTTYVSKSTNFAIGKNKYDHWLEGIKRNGPSIADFFYKHCGEYSKEKKMSDQVMSLPPYLQMQILAGFIDGDGCMDRENGHIIIATSSKNLANQFVLMLRRIGAHTTCSKIISKENNIADKYRVKVIANEAYSLFKDRLKSNKNDLLKKAKWASPRTSLYKNWQISYITKIEDITDQFSDQYMYDIEVEDDHSYVANGIAIHNCFPYAELDESTGKWSKIVIQNCDYIHVKKTVLAGEPIISLKPDAVLQRLVMSNNPADVQLRKQIPEKVLYHVRTGKDIPLDNFNVSHLKMLSSPYDVRGTSIIVSAFKDLMLYDKIRECKFAQADGMINPITLIKLGGSADGDYRASQDDLEKFKQIFEEAQYDKDFKLITHAGVDVQRVGFNGQVLDIAGDMELIIKNIYTGLMVPPAVIDTESAVYASASIGLEVLRQRYFNFRNMIAKWLVNKIFVPISELQDFYEYKDGKKKLIVPEVEWNQMNLYDLQDYISNITGLVSSKQASIQTLYRSLGLNYKEEIVKQRQEMIDTAIRQREEMALSGMSLTELRTLDPEKEILEPIDDAIREQMSPPPEAGMPAGMPGGAGAMPGGAGGLPGGLPELAPPPGGELGVPGAGAPEVPGGTPPLGPGGPGGSPSPGGPGV